MVGTATGVPGLIQELIGVGRTTTDTAIIVATGAVSSCRGR